MALVVVSSGWRRIWKRTGEGVSDRSIDGIDHFRCPRRLQSPPGSSFLLPAVLQNARVRSAKVWLAMADTSPTAHGTLLVNLGTPDSPSVADVRRYLAQFLSDPLVIDLPAPARFALVRGVILPFRPRKSAAAYAKIWTDRGSPLRVHGNDLVQRLRQTDRDGSRLGPVVLGMRYGNPSIDAGLDQLRAQGVQRVTVLPLFPQYSESAWLTAVKACEAAAASRHLALQVIPPFYADPRYLDVLASTTAAALEASRPNKLLMSFHGLPERHLHRTDRSDDGRCLQRDDCCASIDSDNRDCYRAQCYATARSLAQRLQLPADAWEVSFQSRLGRTPWIRPYTDERIRDLAATGCRRLAVVCPAFVADCLETLEEIGTAGRQAFRAYGGEELTLVPALNSDPAWAAAIVDMLLACEHPSQDTTRE